LDDPIARANFRVVVIKPDEVEMCDIKEPTKARRHKYTLFQEKSESGEVEWKWTDEELWP